MLRRLLSLALLCSSVVLAFPAVPTYAAIAVPQAPVALPGDIEPMAPYQPQTFCDPHDKPGVVAFAKLLTSTYPDTSTVDISRPCGTDTSEHYDGRALDWGAYYKNAAQVKEVNATFAWLFAPDAAGNPNAMMRRLGIMYIIWNKQIYGGQNYGGQGDGGWRPYACSGETACHQNHVHFSFDWSGALKKTSFWTGVVMQPMPAPIPVLTDKTRKQVIRVDATRDSVTTPVAVKAGDVYRLTVSGTYRWAAAGADVADAVCSTAYKQPMWTAGAGHGLTVGPWSGWRSTAGTGCNTTTHTYAMSLHPKQTQVLTLTITDINHWDNKGNLTVTLQRVA